MKIELVADNVIHLFDPQDLFTREFTDGAGGDTLDGVYVDPTSNVARQLTLLDGSGTPTTSRSEAATATITTHAGRTYEFEIFDQGGGEPQWATDLQRGQVVRLAANHYIKIDGYPGITGSNARTVAAWVQLFQGGTTGTLIQWGQNSGGKRFTVRINGTTGGQAGAVRSEVNGGYKIGTTDLRDGQWHHVAVVLPSGKSNVTDVLLYVDGQLEGTSQQQAKVINTTAGPDLKIADDHADRRFNGDIDDVRLYSRELSAAEVADLASDTDVAGGLEGHWKMDETGGSVVADATANGRDGSSHNVEAELAGRCTAVKDRNGHGLTVTYKTFTAPELSQSPTRQWQIDTVTDAYGRTAAFTYGATQVSGRWAVSNIEMPNGESIGYQYADGFLSQVDYADGTSATYSRSIDADTGLVKVVSFDPLRLGGQSKNHGLLHGQFHRRGAR